MDVSRKIKGVIKMTIANLSRASAPESASVRSKQIDKDKPEGDIKTADDVMEYLRKMMPGWTITTSSADWSEGFRNIEIDRSILQEMADDPKAMEKYKSLILDLEKTAPELEKWGQENPGQSIEFGISIDAHGNATALAVVKTLMGAEIRTEFNLPSNRTSWAEFIRQRLEDLSQGKVEDAYGASSWIA